MSRNGSVNYENIYSHQDAEVIINTTPVGMYPKNGELILNISRFPNLSGVLDVIYNPLSTRLVLLAKERDIPCSGGLPMLAAQATKAAALFSGKEIPDEKNEEILNFLYSSLQNIVLIGMPGSGKSKIGKKLSDSLSRELLDTDTEIIKNAGKEIPEIFKESGESGFRAIERQAVAECGKQTGKIVATGGGVVLSPENYYSLAQNGRIYFLKRALYKLATKGRPLSKDPNTIKTLYNKRLPLYKKYSDKIIDNNRSANLTCQKIREDFYENLGS